MLGARSVTAPSLLAALATLLLSACMLQPPAPVQEHVQYPVVASSETDAYAGSVDNNLLTGTAYVELEDANTGTHCRGQGHLVTPSADPSCKGGQGACSLTCDDGKVISCKYKLVSCTSGVGVGQDQDQRWVAFAFGPELNLNNVQAVAGKLRTFVSNLPTNVGQKKSAQEYSIGTGFFVSSDGYLVTANHVIANADKIAVLTRPGESFVASVVGTDPANDVALLKADASARPLPIASSDNVSVGEQVLTLGYPLPQMEGQEQKATFGHINALSGEEDDVRFVQTDTPIQPWELGWPTHRPSRARRCSSD